jgi:hypothetical protein
LMLRSVGKALGGDVMADAIAFFQAFEGMEDGFRDRANTVALLLRSDAAAWLLVTSARDDAISEATWFAEQTAELGIRIRLLVANRMAPLSDELPDELPDELAEGSSPPDGDTAAVVAVLRAAHALRRHAQQQDRALAPLIAQFGGVGVLRVAMQAVDVHDLTALASLLG